MYFFNLELNKRVFLIVANAKLCLILNNNFVYPTDLNECDKKLCDQFATCVNSRGSVSCTCNQGYVGNGFECSPSYAGQGGYILVTLHS